VVRLSQGDDSIQTCLSMSKGTVVSRHLHPFLLAQNFDDKSG
jgi:hypothetical protein